MQTLINNFHGTEAHTRLTAAEMDDIETRSAVRPEAVTAAERATVPAPAATVGIIPTAAPASRPTPRPSGALPRLAPYSYTDDLRDKIPAGCAVDNGAPSARRDPPRQI